MGPAGLGAVALCATAALAAAGCGSGSPTSSSSGSATPASLTVWRMGASTPAQMTWMNGVVSQFEQVSSKYKSDWASFPIPSQSGSSPAPAFAGGSDLAVWVSSKYKTADWDLIKEMDSTSNATSFANLQGFFPPFTSELSGGAYSGSQVMSGFAKAATVTRVSPLNAKDWAIADTTDQIIPTMMKSLMQGANFTATVDSASTQLQNVLNTGSRS